VIPLRDDNPTRHPPVFTLAFIILNVAMFAWQSIGGPVEDQKKTFELALVPYNLTHRGEDDGAALILKPRDRALEVEFTTKKQLAERGLDEIRTTRFGSAGEHAVITQKVSPWLTLLTSMFMHGGLMHLLGNMWFLWIFGNNIEDAVGKLRFVIFYLISGLAAHAAHVTSNAQSLIPCIGASGAVSGILGGYLLLYPKARVLTLIPLPYFWQTVNLPAMLFLPIWFGIQLFNVMRDRDGTSGGVAWWAHIGGFVVGFLWVRILESAEHKERRAGRAPPPPPAALAGGPTRRSGYEHERDRPLDDWRRW
jgi:membrane associated rhomboid family serine protease